MTRARSWWKYLFTERLGWRRASPVTQTDLRIRAQAEERLYELERAVSVLRPRREIYGRLSRRG